MKRSKSIKLVAMATAAVTLSACEERTDQDGEIYTTEVQCEAGEFVPDADCAPLFAKGLAIHKETAPRYNSDHLCEDEHGFGQCERSFGHTYYSSPRPYGYLITGALSQVALAQAVRPVYADGNRRRYYMTGGSYIRFGSGRSVKFSSSGVKKFDPDLPRVAPKVQTRTTVVSRNGFGSRSGSFGS